MLAAARVTHVRKDTDAQGIDRQVFSVSTGEASDTRIGTATAGTVTRHDVLVMDREDLDPAPTAPRVTGFELGAGAYIPDDDDEGFDD